MENADLDSLYREGLGHLVGMFRAKGIGIEESRDLAHETILRTLVHLKRHGRTRDDLGPLSRTIARNLLIERIRRAGPTVLSLSDEMDAADDAPGPSEIALQTERAEAVRDAMRSLVPRQRRVIELWMQGRSPAEIARELGIKRNAADAILHRARRTLASRLGPRAMWGGVVLTWLRLKSNAKHAGAQLASWSPDNALAPAGVAVAAVGLVAAISLSGQDSAPVAKPTTPKVAHGVIDNSRSGASPLDGVVGTAAPVLAGRTAPADSEVFGEVLVPVPGDRAAANDGAGAILVDDGGSASLTDYPADLLRGLTAGTAP